MFHLWPVRILMALVGQHLLSQHHAFVVQLFRYCK